MSNQKKFNQDAYFDFLELTGDRPLNKHEMNKYIEGFTKYMEEHAAEYDNDIKETTIRKLDTAKYIRSNRIINIVMNVLMYIFLIAFIIFDWNNTSIPMMVIKLLTILFTLSLTTRKLQTIYIHSRNTRHIKVGHVYLYDINCIHASHFAVNDIYDGKNPFDIISDQKTSCDYIRPYPTLLLVTNIGKKFIYCSNPEDGIIFTIPVSKANYLTCIDDLDAEARQIVIRYPYTMPFFNFSDVKILEAALILAHRDKENQLYDKISEVLAKIRFYTEEPYGTWNEDKANKYRSIIKESLDLLNKIDKGDYKKPGDFFEDNDDIFGDAD